MKWFESFVAFLFPTILIDGTPWRALWDQQEQDSFLRVARFFFPLPTIGYISHYYLFDVPMNLEPTEFWFQFRLTMSLICLGAVLFYFSPLARSRIYKIPAMLACFALCYSQAKVSVWYGKEAWVFFFLFVLTTVFLLRLTSLQSILYGALVIVLSATELVAGGVGVENLVSGSLVTLSISGMVRTAYASEVRNFILNQENISAQNKIIEMNLEFSDRIKSFIPRVISDRLTRYMDEDRLTVVEASIEALKAEKKSIACLFTDIRGFTQGSKEIDRFINESVIPEVKECSDKIEEMQGIPRKIGDLIFAYFDAESVYLNVLRALVSGIEISRINESMNATGISVAIRRYILISAGDAIVGNFGGLDSSVEITALGSPVNFLSRVDDLTKSAAIAEILSNGDLILSESAVDIFSQSPVQIDFERIDLQALNLSIRDFPEEKYLFKLTATDDHYEVLSNLYRNAPLKNVENLVGRTSSSSR